ncbi:MAG: hypothetical protein ABI140_02025 [Jatrophihabitantaceae bacterium]
MAAADPIELLVGGLAIPAGCQLVRREVWLAVHPPASRLEPHGWKLHVSARPVGYPELIELIVPVLVEAGVVFKLATSARTAGTAAMAPAGHWPNSLGNWPPSCWRFTGAG